MASMIGDPSRGLLVLCKHAQTDWSALGKMTGKVNSPLSEVGRVQARAIGEALADIAFDVVFTSDQLRSDQTMHEIMGQSQHEMPPRFIHNAFSGRDYGDLTGKTAIQIEAEIGREAFDHILFDFDTPAPHGESLRAVAERVTPLYDVIILPQLKLGKRILIVSDQSAIRVLSYHVTRLLDEPIPLTLHPDTLRCFSISKGGSATLIEAPALVLEKSS
jgi:2,3-bisphosphoglycerate-dependent phosphoglycerate mutase